MFLFAVTPFSAVVVFGGVANMSPIFFTGDSAGNWDIYSIHADGSSPRRLTTTPFDEKDIALSYDRTRMVYACSDGWIRILDLVKAATVDSFAAKTTPGAFMQPSFCNSGVLFSMLADREHDLWTIYEYHDGGVRELVRMYGSLFYPAPVPGSRSFIYTYNLCTTGCKGMITELWQNDMESATNKQLTMLNSHISCPVFLNCTTCVFLTDIYGTNEIFMYSLSLRKSQPIFVDGTEKSDLVVSSDSKNLAYIEKQKGKTIIRIIDLNTRKNKGSLSPHSGRLGRLAW